MQVRLIAPITALPPGFRVKQFQGFPPELTEGIDHGTPLPRPDVLLIQEDCDGFSLERYTWDGHFGGDTWHENLEDAKYQAEMEYPGGVGDWQSVPGDVTDYVAFALKRLRD